MPRVCFFLCLLHFSKRFDFIWQYKKIVFMDINLEFLNLFHYCKSAYKSYDSNR